MLFLGIDQHARQLTVSLRDQNGDVILARQVSTQPVEPRGADELRPGNGRQRRRGSRSLGPSDFQFALAAASWADFAALGSDLN